MAAWSAWRRRFAAVIRERHAAAVVLATTFARSARSAVG
jgi:hypothetical protein